ncbi:hypothetical protein NMY22_g8491 [Coprinellus aureogranulatus]|nr:hypothetical protein NMY22_g8491 [Coprinellus aureogranulatus]
MDKRCHSNGTSPISRLLQILQKRGSKHPFKELQISLCKDYYQADNELIRQGLPNLNLTWDGIENPEGVFESSSDSNSSSDAGDSEDEDDDMSSDDY